MSLGLLIINPNSSKSVTDNLEFILTAPPHTTLTFYTGPPNAPPEIIDYETSLSSANACFPELRDSYINKYDGFLVCCFSDHPLIYMLREITDKPIFGIFQASLTYSLTQSPSKFGILTSTKSWESILDNSTDDFFGGYRCPLFQGTVASEVDVLKLSDPTYFSKLVEKAKVLSGRESRIILLGCAGLSGLESKLEKEIPGVKFIDSVKIGVELLNALVRFTSN